MSSLHVENCFHIRRPSPMCLGQVQVSQSRSCWDYATRIQREQLGEVAAAGVSYIYTVLDLHDIYTLNNELQQTYM